MRLFVMIFMSAFFFVLLVEILWPEGAAVMERLLRTDKETIVVSALNSFADELEVGEGFLSAFAVFWRDLVF